jgi:hypothetical protein
MMPIFGARLRFGGFGVEGWLFVGACFPIVQMKCIPTVCVWDGGGVLPPPLVLCNIHLLDRYDSKLSFWTDERILVKSGQTKVRTMKNAIGLDKRTKGKDLGYNEGHSGPDVQDILRHSRSVLYRHKSSQAGIVSGSLNHCAMSLAMISEVALLFCPWIH